MGAIKFHKVVSSLPGTLEADTMYMVRVGAGFDLYMTDSSGVAKELNQSPVASNFFPAYSDASDIGGYKTLLPAPSTAAETSIVQANTGTEVFTQVAAFATDPGMPGVLNFPAGIVLLHFHVKTDAAGAYCRLRVNIYKRDTSGTETLITTADSDQFAGTTITTVSNYNAVVASDVTMTPSDRLVL